MQLDIHFYVHTETDPKLDQILITLQHILQKEGTIVAAIDDLTNQVTNNTDTEASAVQLLNNIHAALVNAGTDPVKLTALKTQLGTSQAALAAAIVANTPVAPPPPAV
jgi:hypothetical protein